MARILDEPWTGAAAGTAVSGTNSLFAPSATVAGGTHLFSAVMSHPSYASYVDVTEGAHFLASTGYTFPTTGTIYTRVYFRASVITASNSLNVALLNGTTTVTRFGLNTTGKLVVQNVTTSQTPVSTMTLAANTDYRIEQDLNLGTGEAVMRIYSGANLNGTTPDETFTVTTACAVNPTINAVRIGYINSTVGSASSTRYIGPLAIDDTTQPGPLSGVTLTTVRPNATTAAGGWTTGAASLHAALSDQSNATIITGTGA